MPSAIHARVPEGWAIGETAPMSSVKAAAFGVAMFQACPGRTLHGCARIIGVTDFPLIVLPAACFLTAGFPGTMQCGRNGVNTHSRVNE
jgi:hypothetical protein